MDWAERPFPVIIGRESWVARHLGGAYEPQEIKFQAVREAFPTKLIVKSGLRCDEIPKAWVRIWPTIAVTASIYFIFLRPTTPF